MIWRDLNGDGLYQANEYKPTDISKIIYEENEDRLVLLSGGDCRELEGAEVYRVDNCKSGNRAAVKVGALGAPKPTAFIAEGDCYFDVGLESRGTTWVHRIDNSELVGQFMPTTNIGGLDQTGWVDIGYGVNAHKRKNGEYLILVEDDYLSKVLLYRWCPTNTCVE